MHKIGKKIIGFLALFAVIFAFYSSSAEANTRFPDVKTSRDEILYLANKGIINGYDGGKFGPNDPIKRVHAVQMIIRELGVKTGDAPNPNFKDVKPGDYGYADIAKAKQLGIISGKGAGKFDPNGTLTRGEMAKILVEAYKLTSSKENNFSDVNENHFSAPYIATLVEHNITQGYPGGTFRPDAKLIREHFALFMARLLNDKFKSYQTNAYIRKYEQSVVIIILYNEKGRIERQGSGFITSNNLIATSFENIRGGVKAEAIVEGTGETFLLEGVVDYNEDYDVALLKPVKKTGRPSLLFGKYSTVKLSDTVYAFGFNTMVYPKFRDFREGKVEDLLEVEMDSGDLKIIESLTKFDYGPDYYGGPLLNAKGYVIGMTSDALYDIDHIAHYYAISSVHIDAMVEPYREIKFSNIEVESFSDMPGYGFVGEDE